MSKWTWRPATGLDVTEVSIQGQELFKMENPTGANAQKIFQVESHVYDHKITLAIVNQFFNPNLELFCIARHNDDNRLLAHTWATRGELPLWSTDEMCNVKMAHVDYSLSPRDKIKLIYEMMDLWEIWCRNSNIHVIQSSTMRIDQGVFLKMHKNKGYDIRGSVAYKRLD